MSTFVTGWVKICICIRSSHKHANRKILSDYYSKTEDPNWLSFYIILFTYLWGIQQSLYHFFSLNTHAFDYDVGHCYFNITTFIHLITSNYWAITVPWVTNQPMMNIVSWIFTLHTYIIIEMEIMGSNTISCGLFLV